MISYTLYNYIHVLGILSVTLALGFSLASLRGIVRPRWVMVIQGLGLFLILLGGFGMAARLGFVRDFPMWVQWKIGFWILLGFLPLIFRWINLKLSWTIAAQIAFLVTAAGFAIFKPEI